MLLLTWQRWPCEARSTYLMLAKAHHALPMARPQQQSRCLQSAPSASMECQLEGIFVIGKHLAHLHTASWLEVLCFCMQC